HPRGSNGNCVQRHFHQASLGPPVIVEEIEIVGNRSHSTKAILDYLKVTPGVTFTAGLRRQLLRSLWDSGRFAGHRITADPLDSGVKLRITIVEAPGVPPLTEPMTRGLADHLFPRGSWAWTVWREVCFTLNGKGTYTGSELKRVLASDNSKPLAHWLLTELCSSINSDELAAAIAARGTQRLSRAKFHSDYEVLLGKTLVRLVPAVRWIGGLTEEECALLADLLSVEPQTLDRVAGAVCDASPEDALEILLDLFDQLWVNRWREVAKMRMARIVSEKGSGVLPSRDKKEKL
ncbi:MAG: POTRA domain-containing protein, partial [Pirellulaceae bacterium]